MMRITQNTDIHPETSENSFSDVLMYFSESLLGIDNEEDILWDLAKNCISKLGFVDCVVYLKDETRDVMIQKAAYGPKNPKAYEILEPVERPFGFGIVGHVAQTGNAELIHDASKDNRYRMDDEFRFSEVCVPIIIDGRVIGIIDCEHPEKAFFTEYHLQMLLTMSSICAIKIKSVRDNKALIEKQEKLFKLKEEMLELRLKALNSQLNPHFVFNALNAIQYFITSENKKSALEYLSVFSKLVRFYLKHINSNSVKVNEELNMISWYLKLQKLRYNDQLDYTLEYDISKFQKSTVPPFIVQTLLENVIEHAAFNQHKNQKLNAKFELENNFIILKLKYTYTPNDNMSHTPEYRQQILQWQDQVRLLNSVKDYQIEKEVSFINTENEKGGNITLKLPKLNY